MSDEHVATDGNQKRKKRNELIKVDATDILLGRGKSFKNHPGNIRFQEIINEHRARYFETKSHREKREYTIGIVESICEVGRFLKRDKHTWKEASFETARQKVAHAMQYRQRCLISTASDFSDDLLDESTSIASSVRGEAQRSNEVYDDLYSTSFIDGKLVRKEPFEILSCTEDTRLLDTRNSATIADAYPANLRIVSDVMGFHMSNPNYSQQFRSTCDYASNKNGFCSNEQDTFSDVMLTSSQNAQPFSATEGNSEAFLSKASDEQSADVQIPLPLQAVLRGTSDFSFGDFSLNGDFMSNIEDCNHESV